MPAKKTAKSNWNARPRKPAAAIMVRDRVREMSIAAFHDRKMFMRDIPKLVHEVLEATAACVEESIPRSHRSILREVFDGMSEAVRHVAGAGKSTARELRDRGRTISSTAVATSKRVREANARFLDAVRRFGNKTSKEIRAELNLLAARAERTGSQAAASARKAAQAADGRLPELAGETLRAGIGVARRSAVGLAIGASGLFAGIAEAIRPNNRSATAARPERSSRRPAVKRTKRSIAVTQASTRGR